MPPGPIEASRVAALFASASPSVVRNAGAAIAQVEGDKNQTDRQVSTIKEMELRDNAPLPADESSSELTFKPKTFPEFIKENFPQLFNPNQKVTQEEFEALRKMHARSEALRQGAFSRAIDARRATESARHNRVTESLAQKKFEREGRKKPTKDQVLGEELGRILGKIRNGIPLTSDEQKFFNAQVGTGKKPPASLEALTAQVFSEIYAAAKTPEERGDIFARLLAMREQQQAAALFRNLPRMFEGAALAETAAANPGATPTQVLNTYERNRQNVGLQSPGAFAKRGEEIRGALNDPKQFDEGVNLAIDAANEPGLNPDLRKQRINSMFLNVDLPEAQDFVNDAVAKVSTMGPVTTPSEALKVLAEIDRTFAFLELLGEAGRVPKGIDLRELIALSKAAEDVTTLGNPQPTGPTR